MVFGGVAFLRSLGLDEVMKGAFLQEGKTKISLSLSQAFTSERPGEDPVERQLSTNQKESPLQEPIFTLILDFPVPELRAIGVC